MYKAEFDYDLCFEPFSQFGLKWLNLSQHSIMSKANKVNREVNNLINVNDRLLVVFG